jgi:uncharacterized protein YbaR (Trm112 family)
MGLTLDSGLDQQEEPMSIHPELLEILACPKCKGDIRLNASQDGLICDRCRLVYEIRDGIPIMLIDEAKPLSDS